MVSPGRTELNELFDKALDGRFSRREAIQRGVGLGLSASLMGVILGPRTTSVQAASDDELVIAVTKDPACWNPVEGPCGSDTGFHDLVMEQMIVWDSNNHLSAGLATEWEVIDDLTWEFRLREGVTFANGEPFDAAAVQFMFSAILEPEGKNPPPTAVGSYRLLEEIETVDDLTLRFYTSEPFPLLPNYMAFEPRAVPPAYYEQVGWEEFGQKPIGTGPYQLTEWVKSDHFTLEANPDYWGVAPAIQRVTFRPVPEAATRVAEMKTGGVSIASEIPGELVEDLDTSDGITSKVTSSERVVYINLRADEYTVGADESEIRTGLNQAMREAFQYATNFDPILETILGGLGETIRSGNTITKHEFGFDPDIPDWPYDLEMARQKLDEAGYDGREITLYYAQDSIAQVDNIVQALQAQWAEAGLNVSIHGMEAGVWNENHRARTHPGDIFLSSTGSKALDSDDRLVPLVHSYDPERGLGRVSYFSDPDIDELIEQSQSILDEEEREKLLKQIWALHRDSAHFLTLYSPALIHGVEEGLNWEPNLKGQWGTLADATRE